MNKKKIINDPVYGFITVPYNLVFDLIEHPYFQRLRRITQLGLTHYVYPGALHTRFHHALGAMHLMQQAIKVLRSKNVDITDEEAKGVTIAILLHDIGHGPFSHALEHTLLPRHHEELSILLMEDLNQFFGGELTLAIQIFKKEYPKKFLSELVSGQLDMDRMDYLNRDSFFTGVAEGVIGYDRIIQMLSVVNDELVVEEKGIYSIEKFLIARRIMYWQVYLHRTVLSAEQMLIKSLKRAKMLHQQGIALNITGNLNYFLQPDQSPLSVAETLRNFAAIDDIDVIYALKTWSNHPDFVLSYLSKGLLNRKLLKIEVRNQPYTSDELEAIGQKINLQLGRVLPKEESEFLIFTGSESNRTYSRGKEEIKILFKNGKVLPISEFSEFEISRNVVRKYYICQPKIV